MAAGPGKAYTAREQAEMLFELAGQKPKFISVPVGLMDFIIGAMETIGKVIPSIGVRCCIESLPCLARHVRQLRNLQ